MLQGLCLDMKWVPGCLGAMTSAVLKFHAFFELRLALQKSFDLQSAIQNARSSSCSTWGVGGLYWHM